MRYIYYLTFVVKLLVLLYYHELQPNAMAKSIKFEALTVVDNKKQSNSIPSKRLSDQYMLEEHPDLNNQELLQSHLQLRLHTDQASTFLDQFSQLPLPS